MKMPAARARIARITARLPNDMNADRPVRMSHIANNRKPMFLVNFMIVSFLWDVKINDGLISRQRAWYRVVASH